MTNSNTPYEMAKGLIGTKEVDGKSANAEIIRMFHDVGHAWVEDDSVAWCAAFVGACLERAGLRSTRQLNARSYLDWGVEIDPSEAQEGDIVVLSRGDPNGWQGHVGFYVGHQGSRISVLGGNQANAVNVKTYPVARLLGVRRAGNVSPSAHMTVREVQTLLRDLGYHEVGSVDGKWGPRTRAAVLAFRADHDLPLRAAIDVQFSEAIASASQREIDPERANGKPVGSRIVAASNAQIGLGVAGAVGVLADQIGTALSQAETVRDQAERLGALFGIGEWFAAIAPWVGAAVFFAVIVMAVKAKQARIDDHRTGKTP